MKKLLSSVAILAMATMVLTSCGTKATPTGGGGDGEITLSVATKLSVGMGKSVDLKITASSKATEDIKITVKSSDDAVAKAASETVTIKKGETSVNASISGVAEGTADVSIESSDAEVKAGKCAVTVADKAPASKYMKMEIIESSSGVFFTLMLPSADTDTGEFQTSGFFVHKTDWTGGASSSNILSIDNYGYDVVGVTETSGISCSYVADGTIIDDKLAWVENPGYERGADTWYQMPHLISGTMTTALADEGYIVFKVNFYDSDLGIEDDAYRVWAKVKPSQVIDGNTSTTEAYICVDNSAEFKVGQKS